MKTLVGIIMGSQSDARVMKEAAKALKEFGVGYEMKVVSAHRTPEAMQIYAKTAYERGLKVIIAGAGGAAHLPGMVASLTILPVIGVPISVNSLKGLDSLLSIAQMPKGVPVATVAIDGAYNAGLLAVRMCALEVPQLCLRLKKHQSGMKKMVVRSQASLKKYLA